MAEMPPIDDSSHSRRHASASEPPSALRWRRGSASSFRASSDKRDKQWGGGGRKVPWSLSDGGGRDWAFPLRRTTHTHEADAASGGGIDPAVRAASARASFVLRKLLATGKGSSTFSRHKVGAHKWRSVPANNNVPGDRGGGSLLTRQDSDSKRYGLADPFGEEEDHGGGSTGRRVVVRGVGGGGGGAAEELHAPAEAKNKNSTFKFGGRDGARKTKKLGGGKQTMSEAAQDALLAASGFEVAAAARGATAGPVVTDPCTSPASARSSPGPPCCSSASFACSTASDRGDDTHPNTPFALSPPSSPRSSSSSIAIPRVVKDGSGSGGTGGPLLPELGNDSNDNGDDDESLQCISLPSFSFDSASILPSDAPVGRRSGASSKKSTKSQRGVNGKKSHQFAPAEFKLAESSLRTETETIRRLRQRREQCAAAPPPDRRTQYPVGDSNEDSSGTTHQRAATSSAHLHFASTFSRRMRAGTSKVEADGRKAEKKTRDATTGEWTEDGEGGGSSSVRGGEGDDFDFPAAVGDEENKAVAPSLTTLSSSSSSPSSTAKQLLRDGAAYNRNRTARVPPDKLGRQRRASEHGRRRRRRRVVGRRRTAQRQVSSASLSSSATQYGRKRKAAMAMVAAAVAIGVAYIIVLGVTGSSSGGRPSAVPPGPAAEARQGYHPLTLSPERATSGDANVGGAAAGSGLALELRSELGRHPNPMGGVFAVGVPPHEQILSHGSGADFWGRVPFLGMGIGDGY